MEAPQRLWDIGEVAAYLGIPAASVYKMTGSAGTIPHVKIGGRLRFRKADIDRWIDLLSVSNLDRLEEVKRRAARR